MYIASVLLMVFVFFGCLDSTSSTAPVSNTPGATVSSSSFSSTVSTGSELLSSVIGTCTHVTNSFVGTQCKEQTSPNESKWSCEAAGDTYRPSCAAGAVVICMYPAKIAPDGTLLLPAYKNYWYDIDPELAKNTCIRLGAPILFEVAAEIAQSSTSSSSDQQISEISSNTVIPNSPTSVRYPTIACDFIEESVDWWHTAYSCTFDDEHLLGNVWFNRTSCVSFQKNGVVLIDRGLDLRHANKPEQRKDLIDTNTWYTVVYEDTLSDLSIEIDVDHYNEFDSLIDSFNYDWNPAGEQLLSGSFILHTSPQFADDHYVNEDHFCSFLPAHCAKSEFGDICFQDGYFHGAFNKEGVTGTYDFGVKIGVWVETIGATRIETDYGEGNAEIHSVSTYIDDLLMETVIYKNGVIESTVVYGYHDDGALMYQINKVVPMGDIYLFETAIKNWANNNGHCVVLDYSKDPVTLESTRISYSSTRENGCKDIGTNVDCSTIDMRYTTIRVPKESSVGDTTVSHDCSTIPGVIVECPTTTCE
ncbi:MAG: hypothetical protein OCD76_17825 [Reichenbachiella sp.]